MKKRFSPDDYARFHRITSIADGGGALCAFAETYVENGLDISQVCIASRNVDGKICAEFPGRAPAWSPDGTQ